MIRRVLVVDDDPEMVELLSFNLEQRGYEVLAAHSGLEAVHKARVRQPDLVLLDLMLDGMDGFTVCEFLRHEPSTAGIPVIMVTALSGEMPRMNALESGAEDFITKPFNTERLFERIEQVWESRSSPGRRDPCGAGESLRS